jgi:LmbE family N-acetylglucosaminyl deacetylase
MQRVHEGGGTIRVVYLTNGKAIRRACASRSIINRRPPPTTATTASGASAKRRTSLNALNIGEYTMTFLSFPDGGLGKLMRRYWSERRARVSLTLHAAQSSARIEGPDSGDRVPRRGPDAGAGADHRRLPPDDDSWSPRKEDQHVDHCAAWYFTADALSDVSRVDPEFSTDLVTYIVHYYSWPFEDDGPRLGPPPHLRGGASGWLSLPLTRAEAHAKSVAIKSYRRRCTSWRGFSTGSRVQRDLLAAVGPTSRPSRPARGLRRP